PSALGALAGAGLRTCKVGCAMRICFDARGLAGNLTGAGKAFTRLLGQLREDFPQHEYLLVAPREPARWRLPRQLLWEQVELPLRARRAGAHVLHAPGGTSAPMLGGRKVVMTVHDLEPTLQLVVAGTVIAGRTDFPELVARLDLRARVSVLGYVSERDLPALYRAADAFVYPSFYEGFGLPVLEALACGTPVVAYNTTSLPEVAGDAAILLDPPVTAEALAAAIARAVGDPATGADLVGRGLEQAKRVDWRITADLTMKVYESL